MQRIIALLKRYSNFLYFLVLQAVCFIFLVSGNNYHKAQFWNSSNTVVGWMKEVETNVTDYFSLKEANNDLAAENALLKEQLFGTDSLSASDWVPFIDSSRMIKYEYLPAKVVSSSSKYVKNYITINIGSKDGVDPNLQMGVVGPVGIVGYTKLGCSENYTQVIPILHSRFLLSAIHKKSGQRAPMIWDTDDDRFVATMKDFQNYVDVEVGDTIVTAGTSGKFPRGELIGTVKEIGTQSGTNYLRIKVKLATDFNKVYHVHVVKNNEVIELKELEADNEKEEKEL